MSVDGYIDDATPGRLVLSGPPDLDRVDEVRAGCDAILIGANTIRRDDPSLLVRSPERRARRRAAGLPPDPLKVTVTRRGGFGPRPRFFHTGGDKLVYCAAATAEGVRGEVGGLAEVAPADPLAFAAILADLARRGVRRLLVEGGGDVHTQLLRAGLADELQLAVAPFFVGDPAAPRFVTGGGLPHTSGRRMRLVEARPVGDMVLIRYLLADRPRRPAEGGVSSAERA